MKRGAKRRVGMAGMGGTLMPAAVLAVLAGALFAAGARAEAPGMDRDAQSVRDMVIADRLRAQISASETDAGAGRAPGTGFFGTLAGAGSGHRLSPFRAFLASALVPGSGELALGSATGFAFLGVDAAGWTGWAIYNHKGHRGEDDYRAYVDKYYSRDAYQAVVNQVYAQYSVHCDPAGGDSSFDCINLANYFSLDRDTHSQHYYEDLGKLDKYIFGWQDWTAANWDPARQTVHDGNQNPVNFGGSWAPGEWPTNMPPFESALRAHYQDMRRAANRYFRHADDFSWVLIMNRTVSAFHAAWLAWRREDTGDRGEISRQTFLVLQPPGRGGTARVALGRRF